MNLNWLRRLLEVDIERYACETCEVLKYELDCQRKQNELLLNRLIGIYQNISSAPESITEPEELKPIQTIRRRMPSQVRQQMVEQNDRLTLELLQKKHKEMHPDVIEELNLPVEELERNILEAKPS